MARSAQPISGRSGVVAGTLVVAAICLAFLGIGLRAEASSGFGPAEWQAIRFTVLQAALSALISVVLAVPLARALARR